ncbi:helix-turn-helix domain-containing protein [Herpetosiphon sp. NSE202]|uniref:helix-turn-helix domain-containing protein n=1 Tax=Herpetosiphon sp. NSE202 TaxID=3351349 RepID=UPI00362B23BA
MASLSEAIGAIIKRKRTRDRLTQNDLGAKVGVSGSYISAVEAGNTSPRIAEVEGIAQVFRTTALEMISEAASSETKIYSDSRREQEALLSIFTTLSPDRRQQVYEFVLFQRDLQDRNDDKRNN